MENRESEFGKSPAEMAGDLHEFLADLVHVILNCEKEMARQEHLDNILKYGEK